MELVVNHSIRGIRGMVFDIDGTLLNTLPEIAISVNRVLEKYHRSPYPVEAYNDFVGDGVERLAERAFRISSSHEDFPEIVSDVLEQYFQNFGRFSCQFPSIDVLLHKIQQKGWFIGILSNKPQKMAEQTVSRFFPNVTIDPIIGASEKIPLKPDPWGLNYIMQKWGISPEETVFFGDSVVDIQTAKASGAISAAVTWGFCDTKNLVAEKPAFLFHTVDEILKSCFLNES